MRFNIEVNGRGRTVRVKRPATSPEHHLLVDVDGRQHKVDVRPLGNGRLSIIRLNGMPRSHDVTGTAAGCRGRFDVQLREGVFWAVVDSRRTVRRVRGEDASGSREVVAPMPGRIVRLMVADGDEVVERQDLVVVEAMKMENVLKAPKAGRIKKVPIREGMTVEVGQPLVTFE